MIDIETLKKYSFLTKEVVLKFKSHKWETYSDSTSSVVKCSVCSIGQFVWLIQTNYLTCNEICIKQIIE